MKQTLSVLCGLCLAGLSGLSAHPMDQYRMEVDVSPSQLKIKVMAPLTRADKASASKGDGLDGIESAQIPSFPRIHMIADGRTLEWKEGPAHEISDVYGKWLEIEGACVFEGETGKLTFSLDPGDMAAFVVFIRYPDGRTVTDLLSEKQPLEVSMAGIPRKTGTTGRSQTEVTSNVVSVPELDSSRVFGNYVEHGVWHILTGYDHMLFMAALVLAAVSIWDLVKVVSAFTLAHTITLSLAVLDIFRLNERVVEPAIAASIVFVALQNIFSPQASRGWTRLGVAFGFGLFHGLGFAGGLLDTMAGLKGATALSAIVAFSIGVELGHQVVVIPLYSARRTLGSLGGTRAERTSGIVTQVASGLISLAGFYYLLKALLPAS